MSGWYIMDVLRNVTGPHDASWVKQRAEAVPNFWVGRPSDGGWSSVEHLPEIAPDRGGTDTDNGAQGRAHVIERCIDELIGLCKGIVADSRVEQNEAEFLRSWLDNNRDVAQIWPANVLTERLNTIFQDGVVDEQEQLDLARLLAKFTGVIPGVSDAEQLATRLPIDDPMPDIEFAGRNFCLTGKFVLGSREKCAQIIHTRGGTNHGQPAPNTDYLVIGALGSHDWLHSAYGRKVEAVLTSREQGVGTAIVTEEHWTFFLNPDPLAQSASS